MTGSVVLALVLTLLAATPSPPASHTRHGGITTTTQGGELVLTGTSTTEAGRVGNDTRRGRSSADRLIQVTVPACEGNDVRYGRNDGVMCNAASLQCRVRGEAGSFLVWTFTFVEARTKEPEHWNLTGQRCVRPGEPLTGRREVPALSVEEFRRLPLPAGVVHLQPATGQVLINVKTNAYVGAGPVRLRTTLLGTAVEVMATPESFTWTWGDGHRLTTSDPGAPYPRLRTTHTYTQPGRYGVSVTVTYSGVYRPVGSPDWIPVAGTASVTSPVTQVEAIEARAVLVP